MKPVHEWRIFKNITYGGVPFNIIMGILFIILLISNLYGFCGPYDGLKIAAIIALIIGILGMGLYTYIGLKKKPRNDV